LLSEELNIHKVQFTADLLNPSMPSELVNKLVKKTRLLCEQYKVKVESSFTSAFTRVNHFSHPDPDIRAYWVDWFKKFINVSVELGADAVGSHFGILTVSDLKNNSIRQQRFEQNVDCWLKVAEYGAKKGLKMLTWEPMSIAREYGETLAETERIQNYLEQKDFAIPLLMCLDVDHGDPCSKNPDDTNPYLWLEKFGAKSPQVHLKQSMSNKGGHRPFAYEYNKTGKIIPAQVIEALTRSGTKEVALYLELSFREREPVESRVVSDLKQSIEFWRPFVN
jgi:sugar phosphate isomerase/epimerase